jgi:hypothetical protein
MALTAETQRDDVLTRLRGAFPAGLSADLDRALLVLPPQDSPPSRGDVGRMSVAGARVRAEKTFNTEVSDADYREHGVS